MNLSRHAGKLTAAAVILTVVAGAAVVNFTEVCRLEAVTLNDQPVADWQRRFTMLDDASMFRQPLDHLARAMLAQDSIYKVDVSCVWPHTLRVTTNAFTPTCLLLDKTTGRLQGLDAHGRIVPLSAGTEDGERPVLTGAKGGPALRYCPDTRVKVVAEQLELLRVRNAGLFCLIDEIDMTPRDHVQVMMAGQPYLLLVRPDDLANGLARFVEFVTRYNPNMKQVTLLDLRFDNLILATAPEDTSGR